MDNPYNISSGLQQEHWDTGYKRYFNGEARKNITNRWQIKGYNAAQRDAAKLRKLSQRHKEVTP